MLPLLLTGAGIGGAILGMFPSLRFKANELIHKAIGKNILADFTIDELNQGQVIFGRPLSKEEMAYITDNWDRLNNDAKLRVLTNLSSELANSYKQNSLTKAVQYFQNVNNLLKQIGEDDELLSMLGGNKELLTDDEKRTATLLSGVVNLSKDFSKPQKFIDTLQREEMADRVAEVLQVISLPLLALGFGGRLLGSALGAAARANFIKELGNLGFLSSGLAFTSGVGLEAYQTIKRTGSTKEALAELLELTPIPIGGKLLKSKRAVDFHNLPEEAYQSLLDGMMLKENVRNTGLLDLGKIAENVKEIDTSIFDTFMSQKNNEVWATLTSLGLKAADSKKTELDLADNLAKMIVEEASKIDNPNTPTGIIELKNRILQDPVKTEAFYNATISRVMDFIKRKLDDFDETTVIKIMDDENNIYKTFSATPQGIDDLVKYLKGQQDDFVKNLDSFTVSIEKEGVEKASQFFQPIYIPTGDTILRAKIDVRDLGLGKDYLYVDLPLHDVYKADEVIKAKLTDRLSEGISKEVLDSILARASDPKYISIYTPPTNLFLSKIKTIEKGLSKAFRKAIQIIDDEKAVKEAWEEIEDMAGSFQERFAQSFAERLKIIEEGLKQAPKITSTESVFQKLFSYAKNLKRKSYGEKLLQTVKSLNASEETIKKFEEAVAQKSFNAEVFNSLAKDLLKQQKQTAIQKEFLKEINRLAKTTGNKDYLAWKTYTFTTKPEALQNILKDLKALNNELEAGVKTIKEQYKSAIKFLQEELNIHPSKLLTAAPEELDKLKDTIKKLKTTAKRAERGEERFPKEVLEQIDTLTEYLKKEGLKASYMFKKTGRGFYHNITNPTVLAERLRRYSTEEVLYMQVIDNIKTVLKGMKGAAPELQKKAEILGNFLQTIEAKDINSLGKIIKKIAPLYTAMNFATAFGNFFQTSMILAHLSPMILKYYLRFDYFIKAFRDIRKEINTGARTLSTLYKYNPLALGLNAIIRGALRAMEKEAPQEFEQLVKNLFGKDKINIKIDADFVFKTVSFDNWLFMPVATYKNVAKTNLNAIGENLFFWWKYMLAPVGFGMYLFKSRRALWHNWGAILGISILGMLLVDSKSVPVLMPAEQIHAFWQAINDIFGLDMNILPEDYKDEGLVKGLLLYKLGTRGQKETFAQMISNILSGAYFVGDEDVKQKLLANFVEGLGVLKKYRLISQATQFTVDSLPLSIIAVAKSYLDTQPKEPVLQRVLEATLSLPALKNLIDSFSEKVVLGKVLNEEDKEIGRLWAFGNLLGALSKVATFGYSGRLFEFLSDVKAGRPVSETRPLYTRKPLYTKEDLRDMIKSPALYRDSLIHLYHHNPQQYYEVLYSMLRRLNKLKPNTLAQNQEILTFYATTLQVLYEVNKEIKDDTTHKVLVGMAKYFKAKGIDLDEKVGGRKVIWQ